MENKKNIFKQIIGNTVVRVILYMIVGIILYTLLNSYSFDNLSNYSKSIKWFYWFGWFWYAVLIISSYATIFIPILIFLGIILFIILKSKWFKNTNQVLLNKRLLKKIRLCVLFIVFLTVLNWLLGLTKHISQELYDYYVYKLLDFIEIAWFLTSFIISLLIFILIPIFLYRTQWMDTLSKKGGVLGFLVSILRLALGVASAVLILGILLTLGTYFHIVYFSF